MNTLIRVSGGLWDISLALLYFSQLVGSGGRYMASVSSIKLLLGDLSQRTQPQNPSKQSSVT